MVVTDTGSGPVFPVRIKDAGGGGGGGGAMTKDADVGAEKGDGDQHILKNKLGKQAVILFHGV